MYDILELNKKLVPELREIAKDLNIKRVESLKKQDLVYKILDTQAIQEAGKTERRNEAKEPAKEDKGIKSFVVKNPTSPEKQSNMQQEDLRGNRPRRERIEPILKREKVETGKKKQVKQESSGVQSRQEQIKAIIKGFGRDKPSMEKPVNEVIEHKNIQEKPLKLTIRNLRKSKRKSASTQNKKINLKNSRLKNHKSANLWMLKTTMNKKYS